LSLKLREDTPWEENKAKRLKITLELPLHVRKHLVRLRDELGLTYTMTVALAIERMVSQLEARTSQEEVSK
jgi:hypothetical protein